MGLISTIKDNGRCEDIPLPIRSDALTINKLLELMNDAVLSLLYGSCSHCIIKEEGWVFECFSPICHDHLDYIKLCEYGSRDVV